MLSEQDKKEMLQDGLNPKRQQDFEIARRLRPESARSLDHYMAFLLNLQELMPFKKPAQTNPFDRNIL